jgi:hypothetical protein
MSEPGGRQMTATIEKAVVLLLFLGLLAGLLTVLRACLKLSRLEHALEAHAGHEQRGEDGHVPRAGGARLVVDAQAAVAL